MSRNDAPCLRETRCVGNTSLGVALFLGLVARAGGEVDAAHLPHLEALAALDGGSGGVRCCDARLFVTHGVSPCVLRISAGLSAPNR